MAFEVRSFQITIPKGTPISAGFNSSLDMPPRIVREINVIVPPGPRGEVGFSIGASGVAILPIQEGAYIISDNEVISWPLQNQIDSGGWQFFGYNTGSYDHTIYIRFLVDPTTTPPTLSVSGPITIS